jgi:two-component system LytT family response regulator
MSFNCLIIDDEPLARKVIEKYLLDYPQLLLLGSFENAVTAFEIMSTQTIDLLFLDIQMPGVNGLQFIRSLKHPPAVIFITAYSEYGADTYELDAIDYLVKPVSAVRFARSIEKFFKQASHETKERSKNFLLIKCDGRQVKIFHDEIRYIEARKDYLMIYTDTGSLMTHMTVKAMEALLPHEQFKRVHRSYIVAIDAIKTLGPYELEIDGKKIPVGEKYRKQVTQLLKHG